MPLSNVQAAASQPNAGSPSPPGTPESTDAWYWPVAIVLAYGAGLATLASALRHNVGFPLDDSWIHQVIARNLVVWHSWGFIPGVTSSGSSSTLWTLVLALQHILAPRQNPVLYPLVLNGLMLIACGLLLWSMARLDGLDLSQSLALGLLPALSGNLIWLAFTGMEHVMFLALSLLSVALWFRAGTSAAVPVAAGASLGALGLTRPEGLALAVMLVFLYRRCGRTPRDVAIATSAAAILILPSFALNWKTSGSLLPMTLRGRRYMYSGSDHLHIGRSSFRGLILNTYKDVIAHHFFHHATGWLVTALVAISFLGLFILLTKFPGRISVVCAWAVVDYVAYCVTLPEPGHGGRYQPFVLLLFAPLLAIGLMSMLRTIAGRLGAPATARNALVWVSLLVVAAITTATLPRWRSALHDSIATISSTHIKMAGWLDRSYPPGTPIAVFDIGAIGYYSHVRVVDLGGLVDRNYLPYLTQRRVLEYLNERGVQYVILPHTGDDTHFADLLNLSHNRDLELAPIHTESADLIPWKNGFAYTGNAHQEQTLYRIQRTPH